VIHGFNPFRTKRGQLMSVDAPIIPAWFGKRHFKKTQNANHSGHIEKPLDLALNIDANAAAARLFAPATDSSPSGPSGPDIFRLSSSAHQICSRFIASRIAASLFRPRLQWLTIQGHHTSMTLSGF